MTKEEIDIKAGEEINGTVDLTYGILLFFFMMAGIPGNILSCVFFLRKKTRNLHDVLYILASFTDMFTLISAFAPITVVISETGRSEMVFSNHEICTSWTVFYYFCGRFSIFIVMIISINRSIAIAAPFHIISNNMVFGVCIVYAVWLLCKDAVFLATYGKIEYGIEFASCIFIYRGSVGRFFISFLAVELFLVSLIILLCFFVCLRSLVNKRVLIKDVKKFREISVTIAIFTASCLMCNMPLLVTFILQLSNTLQTFSYQVRCNLRFMSLTLFIVLNAALNPIIYVVRMPAYRNWIYKVFHNQPHSHGGRRFAPTTSM